MVVKSDGNGELIVKKIYALIALLILIASITSTVVTIYGIDPLKQDVVDIKLNDKCQDDDIAELKTVKAVRDVEYKYIIEKLDEINKKLPIK